MKMNFNNPWLQGAALGIIAFCATTATFASSAVASPTQGKEVTKPNSLPAALTSEHLLAQQAAPATPPATRTVSPVRQQLIANTACRESTIPVIGIQTAGDGVPSESVGAYTQMGIGFIAGTTEAYDGTDLTLIQTAAHANQPNNELAAIKRDNQGNVAPAPLVYATQDIDTAVLAVRTEDVQSRRTLDVHTGELPLGTTVFQCTQDGRALSHAVESAETTNPSMRTFIADSQINEAGGTYSRPLQTDPGGGGITIDHGDSGGAVIMVSETGEPLRVGMNIAGDGDIIERTPPQGDMLNVLPDGRTMAVDAIGMSGEERSFTIDAAATEPHIAELMRVSPLMEGFYEQGLLDTGRS